MEEEVDENEFELKFPVSAHNVESSEWFKHNKYKCESNRSMHRLITAHLSSTKHIGLQNLNTVCRQGGRHHPANGGSRVFISNQDQWSNNNSNSNSNRNSSRWPASVAIWHDCQLRHQVPCGHPGQYVKQHSSLNHVQPTLYCRCPQTLVTPHLRY